MGNTCTSEESLLYADFLDSLKFPFTGIKHLFVYTGYCALRTFQLLLLPASLNHTTVLMVESVASVSYTLCMRRVQGWWINAFAVRTCRVHSTSHR